MSSFLKRTRNGKCKTESGGVSFGCVYLDILEVKVSSSRDLACTAHSPFRMETSVFYPWMTSQASP